MARRFPEAEILGFLRQAAAGTPVIDLCWNHCIRRSTFYAWKAKYRAATDGETRLRNSIAHARSDLERSRGEVSGVPRSSPRTATTARESSQPTSSS